MGGLARETRHHVEGLGLEPLHEMAGVELPDTPFEEAAGRREIVRDGDGGRRPNRAGAAGFAEPLSSTLPPSEKPIA